MQPDRRYSQRRHAKQPLPQPGKLVRLSIAAMQRDDQAWRKTLAAEPFDCRLRLGGGCARAFERAVPPHVIELSRTVDGNTDMDGVLAEHPNMIVVD